MQKACKHIQTSKFLSTCIVRGTSSIFPEMATFTLLLEQFPPHGLFRSAMPSHYSP